MRKPKMNHTILFLLLFYFFPIRLLAQKDASIAWTASWSNDDKYVAVGNNNGKLVIFETKNWKKIKQWNYKATTFTRVEWNPKYSLLAIAGYSHEKTDSIVQIFDIKTGKAKYLPNNLQGRAVSWSPDGEKVVFASGSGGINMYSKTGDFLKKLDFENKRGFFDVDWHPRKNILLLVEEDIFIYDIDSNKLVKTLDDGAKNKGLLSCQWHPSGDMFATGDYGHENEGGQPSLLKFWKTDGTLIKTSAEGKSEYRNLRWSKDGKYLAASSDKLMIHSSTGILVKKIKLGNDNIWGVDWNRKGDKIIASDQGGHIWIINEEGKILFEFKL